MNAQTPPVSSIFQNSRRRSNVLLAGVLLALGYFGAGALLVRDYTVQSSTIERSA
ncbi:MAG TPA: hypothetical protein VMT11_09315 [Myxococcaceae bacterium]|nr:hypothetical protein [Myxococcaceae bacterium]